MVELEWEARGIYRYLDRRRPYYDLMAQNEKQGFIAMLQRYTYPHTCIHMISVAILSPFYRPPLACPVSRHETHQYSITCLSCTIIVTLSIFECLRSLPI